MIPRPSHVTATVRKLRVRDLHHTWEEPNLEAFDYLVEMWHRMDPDLWKHLSANPEGKSPQDRAQRVLERAGWL